MKCSSSEHSSSPPMPSKSIFFDMVAKMFDVVTNSIQATPTWYALSWGEPRLQYNVAYVQTNVPWAWVWQWQQECDGEPEKGENQNNYPLNPVVGQVTNWLPNGELQHCIEMTKTLKDCKYLIILHIYMYMYMQLTTMYD